MSLDSYITGDYGQRQFGPDPVETRVDRIQPGDEVLLEGDSVADPDNSRLEYRCQPLEVLSVERDMWQGDNVYWLSLATVNESILYPGNHELPTWRHPHEDGPDHPDI